MNILNDFFTEAQNRRHKLIVSKGISSHLNTFDVLKYTVKHFYAATFFHLTMHWRTQIGGKNF